MTVGSDEAIVRGILRCERPWRDVALLGIGVEREPDGLLRANFARDVHLVVPLRELAAGVLQPPPSRDDAQVWAFVVAALTSPSESDEHPAYEVVMDALWEMSFGEALRPELRETLERFVAAPGQGKDC
jgi:hypothetical protein